VEGHEPKVLAGARKTITKLRPVLFVENNSQERSREVLIAIVDLGYNCWWHIADYFNPQNCFGKAERLFGEYREANVLCFPKEAQVNAGNLWPVEGIDDTFVKALQRHS
jgi:hypothetical protein